MDTTPRLTKRLFKNELKTYFNLSEKIVNMAEENWNTIYYDSLATFMGFFPDGFDRYGTNLGFAYLQWSDSLVTRAGGEGDSVIEAVDTAVGYPELYYFKEAYFMPSINAYQQ
jgi:hypothetical protein